MLSRCFLYFSESVGAFVIGQGQIPSFFLLHILLDRIGLDWKDFFIGGWKNAGCRMLDVGCWM